MGHQRRTMGEATQKRRQMWASTFGSKTTRGTQWTKSVGQRLMLWWTLWTSLWILKKINCFCVFVFLFCVCVFVRLGDIDGVYGGLSWMELCHLLVGLSGGGVWWLEQWWWSVWWWVVVGVRLDNSRGGLVSMYQLDVGVGIVAGLDAREGSNKVWCFQVFEIIKAFVVVLWGKRALWTQRGYGAHRLVLYSDLSVLWGWSWAIIWCFVCECRKFVFEFKSHLGRIVSAWDCMLKSKLLLIKFTDNVLILCWCGCIIATKWGKRMNLFEGKMSFNNELASNEKVWSWYVSGWMVYYVAM